MKTHIHEAGRARILVGEHVDRCYLALGVDGATIGTFLDADKCMEAASDLIEIARRIRKRAKKEPS